MKLIAGTRGSALALKQTDAVVRKLMAADPALEVEVRVIETKGDTNLSPIPLDSIGKGWFTHEIEDALAGGLIDFAVHSLKDMAEVQPEGLTVAAYPEREDARDALVSNHKGGIDGLTQGAIVGTDSARRGVQLRALRPDIVVKSVRGSVPTRLEKLRAGGYDAVVLAVAGLKRLGREDEISCYFSIDEMTPAPGQGILAVQARDSDSNMQRLLARINDPAVEAAALLERSFARAAGAGCKSPVGAYAEPEGDAHSLTGMLSDENPLRIVRDRVRVEPQERTRAAKELAQTLYQKLGPHAYETSH